MTEQEFYDELQRTAKLSTNTNAVVMEDFQDPEDDEDEDTEEEYFRELDTEDPWSDIREYLIYGKYWITRNQDLVEYKGPTETFFHHKGAPKSVRVQMLAEPINTIWHVLPLSVEAVKVKQGKVVTLYDRHLNKEEVKSNHKLFTTLPNGVHSRPNWARTPLQDKLAKPRN